MVQSGNVKSLIDGLILPLNQDMSFAEVFLANHRFFVPAQKVFYGIVSWYNLKNERNLIPDSDLMLREYKTFVQSRVLRVILLWIKNHWQDFYCSARLMSDLNNFADYLSGESFNDYQKLIHSIREQRLSWYTLQYIPMFSGMNLVDDSLWSPEMDTDSFAHNLTLLDHLFFRQMRPDVYLHILATPGTIYGGGFNISLKTLLDYCGWFRMVNRNLIIGCCLPYVYLGT